MARLDADARQKLEVPERIADAFVAEVLSSGGNASALSSAVGTLAIQAGQAVDGKRDAIETMTRRAHDTLSADLPPEKTQRSPFHWPLEFPEVFARSCSGFDALVGNPPFLGNRLWKSAMGDKLQWQCQMVLGASPGKIDLCVVFHRRAVDLLRTDGCYGLLATSNIAEGSAIEVGLGVVVQNGTIYFAKKGMPWPGTAAVVVAIVGFIKGEWQAECDADGRKCARIGPRLEPEASDVWVPETLPDAPFTFAGVDNSKGLAFVITPDSPWFERLQNEPDSLLRPYITGDDITSSALNRIGRWALDIGDRSLDEIARRWPIAHRFIVEEVQPTRTVAALKSYKGLIDRWWQFWNHRADLMRRIRQKPNVHRLLQGDKVSGLHACRLDLDLHQPSPARCHRAGGYVLRLPKLVLSCVVGALLWRRARRHAPAVYQRVSRQVPSSESMKSHRRVSMRQSASTTWRPHSALRTNAG
jgi:hypothetical protein